MTTANPSPSKQKPVTKSSLVCKLPTRPPICPRGAIVPELMTATDGQNHSVRAVLTGLRKKGLVLMGVREERTLGEQAYRLVQLAATEQVAA